MLKIIDLFLPLLVFLLLAFDIFQLLTRHLSVHDGDIGGLIDHPMDRIC